MKTKRSAISFLFIMLAFAAYLDSPYSFINKPYSFTASEPAFAQNMDQTVSVDSPDIEEKLVKKKMVDGYIVESYREFEVFKDKDGNVIKKVPTSQYDELKYWDYKKK